MKNISKKLISLLTVIIMLFSMAPVAMAGVEYSVEDAYYECAELYPEFVEKLTSQGVSDAKIITFLETVQEYLLNLNEEVTEDNFEEYIIEAVNQAIALRKNIAVRNALVAAFPDAVVDGVDGIINEEFIPLVETIKSIIFEHGMLEGDEQPTEETDEPTEKETEAPTEKETEKDTEPATEKDTEKPTSGPVFSGDYSDDVEDTTEAPTEKETGTQTAPKVTFSDINQATWAEKAINSLVEMGVINGYPDGTFKPNNPITRAEFAKIIVLASGRYTPGKETYTSTFSDVPSTQWHYSFVSAAYKFGFIKGRSETIFDPNSNITRADLCLIVYRYIKSINPEFKVKTDANGQVVTFADAVNVPSYAQEAVTALYSNGIAPVRDSVNNKFEPTLPATRAECAYIVYNATRAALGLAK